jgi:hypothetical protein
MEIGGPECEGQKQGQKINGKSMAGFHLPGEIAAFLIFELKLVVQTSVDHALYSSLLDGQPYKYVVYNQFGLSLYHK